MAKTLDNVAGLRLANVECLRKTRSRLLRLLVKEEPSAIDLPFWTLVFKQLDSLRHDFALEKDHKGEDRLQALEQALEAHGAIDDD